MPYSARVGEEEKGETRISSPFPPPPPSVALPFNVPVYLKILLLTF
jgi:hypothetical protein